MKKLSKKEYNSVVKAKILQTGLYNGRSVEEAEIDDELLNHLDEIRYDYRKGELTAFNADAHIAYNYFKYENENEDDLDIDIDSNYGYLDNDDYTVDLKIFLGSY